MPSAPQSLAFVVNLQRKVKVETGIYKKFAQRLTESVDEAAAREFSVAFVSDDRMRELNSLFRDKPKTTDVLSFPYESDSIQPADTLGDIVISAEQAAKQAADNGLSLETEIKQLMLHGLLHLCGHDHETDEGEMNKRELELRDMLSISAG